MKHCKICVLFFFSFSVITITFAYATAPPEGKTTTVYVLFQPLSYTAIIFISASTVTGLHCEYFWTNKAVILVWDHPNVVQSVYLFEVQVNGGSPKIINETRYRIDDVPSAEYFDVNVTSLNRCRRSRPVSIRCKTKLKGETESDRDHNTLLNV